MTGLPASKPFKVFTVRVSYYWPALGGTNCYPTNWIKDKQHPMGGTCRSKLLGEPWSSWVGVGAACPPSVELRQRIFVEKLNKSFIDLLQPAPAWWPDAEVITDFLCPSGCITSPAYVME